MADCVQASTQMSVGVMNADQLIEKKAEDIVDYLYKKKDEMMIKIDAIQKEIENPKFLSDEEESVSTLQT